MKAISKKLLSLLVVIAMVLSMVPFGGLSIFAVETKAAETDTQSTETEYVNPGEQAKEDAAVITAAANALDPTTATSCPVCGDGVTWTKLSTSTNVAAGGHYYIGDTVTSTSINWINVNNTNIADGDTFCVHLNGKAAEVGGRVFINKKVTANFMGTGSVTSTSMHTYNSGTAEAPVYSNTGLFQITNGATLNLYGGTYTTTNERAVTAPNNTSSYYGTISVNYASAKVNIYNGTTLSVDPAGDNKGTNIATGGAAVINMYGGTITGGTGYPYHTKEDVTSSNAGTQTYAVAGGNVYLRGGATFNMYYGTIESGNADVGGNVLVYKGATFNQYGGTITGGTSTGTYGGNIALGVEPGRTYVAQTYGGTFTQYKDGIVSNGTASNSGGNIGLRAGAATIGGTVSGGKVDTTVQNSMGGNVYVMGGVLKFDGATITQDGTTATACCGGNIAIGNKVDVSIKNSTISGGVAARGGNIDLANGQNITIENCTISGGKTVAGTKNSQANGGNIFLQQTHTAITITDSQISGGKAEGKYGGNIYCTTGEVTIAGTTTVTGGTANQGGNIWLSGTADTAADWGTLRISGGTISGGEAAYGATVRLQPGSALIMTGGEINGQVQPTDGACTNKTATITVSGEAKITGHGLDCGQDGILLTDAGLTGTASIAVYQIGRPFVQYTDETKAAAAKGYYVASQSGYGVVVNTDGTLEIGEVEAEYDRNVFQPWVFDDAKAYCPVCQADVTGWKEVGTGYTNLVAEGGVHYYLADDVFKSGTQQAAAYNSTYSQDTIVDMFGCFNLNGHTLSLDGRLALTTTQTTLNIMDTEGGGAITSTCEKEDSSGNYGNTIVVQGAGTINLYGGTYTNTKGTNAVIRVKNNANAKLNIYEGAVIDGGGIGRGVQVDNGTVTLDGGTIQNGIATIGGNVYVASGKNFVMNSGYIKDGKATNNVLDSTSDYVYDGGGNIYSLGNVTLNGGTVQDGKACGTGGNIHCAGGTLTIGDGTATTDEITVSGGKTGVTIGEATLANGYGGNIGVTAGTATVQAGALITDGSTVSESAKGGYGGNIYTFSAGVLNIKGGTVTAGQSGRGGNIDMNNGKVTISGGTVSYGVSTGTGGAGNVFVQNKGTLTIKDSAHLIGGTAQNGGSIRHTGTAAQIVISGGTIEDGNATQSGGNIYSDAANGVKISGTAVIKEGTAQRNGGNICISSASTLAIEGGEIHNGTAAEESDSYSGGNIYSGGKVTMSGGTVHTGTAALGPGGNVVVSGADMEMSGDATIYGGTATAHQGGNVRVYKGKLTMSDTAKIYGGHSGSGSKSHNVWIVAGDMEMSGDSYVYGKEQANGNAIALGPTGGINSTLTLKDNAKVMNDPTDPVVSKGSINLGYTAGTDADLTNDMHANIVIDDSWTGEAYIMMNKSTGALNAAGTATAMAWLSIGDTVDGGEGSVNGPVGTGTSFTGNLYYTARTYYTGIIGSAEGKLVLVGYGVVAADGTTEWFANSSDAIDAIEEGEYLVAAANVEVAEGKTVYIDALSDITVTGSGTAYGIDPANADFTTKSTGKFSGNVESDATFNGVRYLKIADGSVHAIEMGVTGVSLRPTAVGLYYKATYKCDETLAAAITAYGVVLSVEDMPGVDFTETPTDQFTVREDFSDLYAATTVANTVTANSGSVFGIMKDGKTNNQERGEMKIYANAYILVNNEAIYVGDTKNADKNVDTQGFDGVALSLYDVLKKIDDQVTAGKLELSQTNIEQITELYNKIKAWGVSWTFANIQ